MQLPFTPAQFVEVFQRYNEAVWPMQVCLVALAVAAVALATFPRRWTGVAISTILAFLWAWLGVAYHLVFFAPINPAAYGFAAVSLAGAGVFVWHGIVQRRLEFRLSRSVRSLAGLTLIGFALAVYPVWASYAGHRYPALPTFGLPCPTTLFTVGMLSLLVGPYPRLALLVPVLWCFVGLQAAFLLGVPQDFALLAAGLFGIFLMVRARPPNHA